VNKCIRCRRPAVLLYCSRHEPPIVESPPDSAWGSVAFYGALALILAVPFLTACAPALKIPDPPKEVRVPVAIPCLKPEDIPQRPNMLTDAQLDALDDKRAVIALGHDRRVRQAYQVVMEAVVQGCR